MIPNDALVLWYKVTMKVEVTRTLKNIVKMRYEDGVLKVVANCFLSDRRLRKIIQENSEWIKARKQEESKKVTEKVAATKPQEEKEDKVVRQKPKVSCDEFDYKEIFAGRRTVILGEAISVVSTESTRTMLDENILYVSDKFYQSRDGRLKAIKAYLKKIATLYVSTEIANFGSRVSLCPVKIEFREIPDAWLKCSNAAQRILTIDYRVVQLPQEVRQYVIAHAFAHFFHPIHDEKFWQSVSKFLPNYEKATQQLESYRFLKDV